MKYYLLLDFDKDTCGTFFDWFYFENRPNAHRLRKKRGAEEGLKLNFQEAEKSNIKKKLILVAGDFKLIQNLCEKLGDDSIISTIEYMFSNGEVLRCESHNKCLNVLASGDVLYISTHGQYNEGTDNPTNKISVSTSYKNDCFLSPTEVKDFLIEHGLPEDQGIRLKMFCCFGAGSITAAKMILQSEKDADAQKIGLIDHMTNQTVIGQLASALKAPRPKVAVSGYVGAVRIPARAHENKLAGALSDKIASKPAKDYRVDISTKGEVTLPKTWTQWL